MVETDILNIPLSIPSDPEVESKKSNAKFIEEEDETPKFLPP
jgi:hypothetical protein